MAEPIDRAELRRLLAAATPGSLSEHAARLRHGWVNTHMMEPGLRDALLVGAAALAVVEAERALRAHWRTHEWGVLTETARRESVRLRAAVDTALAHPALKETT